MGTTDADDDGTESLADRALSDQIAEELHRRILVGEIPLGSKLGQHAVAMEFRVSRMPVREAFRALQGQGVIEIVPRRGAIVRGTTPRDIRENGEVRAELEGMAAELAAERIDDVQLARLRDAARRFEQVSRLASDTTAAEEASTAWREANAAFHDTLVESADNAHLTASVEDLRRRIPQNAAFVTIQGNTRLVRDNAAEHAEILAAIEAHDGKKARRLIRAHLMRASERVARRYERELSKQPR